MNEWHSMKELPKKPENYDGLSIPVLVQYIDESTDLEVLRFNFYTKKFCFDQTDLTDYVYMWRYLPEKYPYNKND